MTITGGAAAFPKVDRSHPENSIRYLLPQTLLQTRRILLRWRRDFPTIIFSIGIPVLFMFTVYVVGGQQFLRLTGHSLLTVLVPLTTLAAAVAGSSIGALGLIREYSNGLLSRLWMLPVHRASGFLARMLAEMVRIFVTTLVVLITGVAMGFRFSQGFFPTVLWLIIPVMLGVAFSTGILTVALFWASNILVEAVYVVYVVILFFSTGILPLSQYPKFIQPIVAHQPVTYAIESMRGLSSGGPVLFPLIATVLWSVGILAACIAPVMIGYRKVCTR